MAVSGNYSKGSYHKPRDLDWEKVGKGGDKDTYKLVKAPKKKSTKEIIIGLVPLKESKVKKTIKAKLPKKLGEWNYKKFERTFFKEGADGDAIKKIDKYGKAVDRIDGAFKKYFEKFSFVKRAFNGSQIVGNFSKRIKKGKVYQKHLEKL